MNSEITIRRAVKEDCKQMLELVHELAVFERAPEEVTVTLEHFCESGFGPNPVWWAFVATSPGPTEGGEVLRDEALETKEIIVGFALYYIRYSTWKGQRMYLEDIIVTEEQRGKGIGGMLMEALIQEGKEKKFNGISWQVLDWNEPAIRFYKKYETRFDGEWLNVMMQLS